VIDACLAHGVTLTSMVPSMAPRFLEAAARRGFDGGSLRAILFTGEPFPGPLQRAVREAFPRAAVYGFYASTEGGVIASLDPVDQEAHPGSVGRPRPGVEVRVVGPDGNDLPAGEAGELWIRGGEPGTYAVCKGYLGDPPETSAAWVDGWYRSGDVGRYDADGFLYVVGRVKDMIISGGLNIAAREVEEVVGEHPAVSEVAVVGVPDPDYGEAVLAYVVTRPGATCTAEEIVEHCRATMASYKKPRHVRFVSDLPRNAVGKIDKLALRALALEPA
jgi:long-chain acyl-CoA synthetase